MAEEGTETSQAVARPRRRRRAPHHLYDREFVDLIRHAREKVLDRDAEVIEDLIEALQANVDSILVFEQELHAQNLQLESAYTEMISERQRFRALLEQAPLGYVVTDLAGIITDANRVAAHWVGREPHRIVGKPFAVFVTPERRGQFRSWVNHLPGMRTIDTGPLELATASGAPDAVSVAVSVIRDRNGLPTGLTWVLVPDAEPAPPTAAAADAAAARALLRAGTGGDAPLTVGIVHRDDLFVRGLSTLLRDTFADACEATVSGPEREEVDRMLAATRPQVVLLEVTEDTLVLVSDLARDHPDLIVMALTEREDLQVAALRAGASGVLPAAASPTDLFGALLGAGRESVTMPRSLAASLLVRGPDRLREALPFLDEEDVRLLRSITAGASSSKLGEDLHLSTRTVKRRIAELYGKLNVDNRVQAAALAGRLGLIDVPEETEATRPLRQQS